MKHRSRTPVFIGASLLAGACAPDGLTEPLTPEPEPTLTIMVDDTQVAFVEHTGRVTANFDVSFSNVDRLIEWDLCETVLERQGGSEQWLPHWSSDCAGSYIVFGPIEPPSSPGSIITTIGWPIETTAAEFPFGGSTFRLNLALADEDGPIPADLRVSRAFQVTWLWNAVGGS